MGLDKRPVLTGPLVQALANDNYGFLGALYRGANETNLSAYFDVLNFRELAVLLAASWVLRYRASGELYSKVLAASSSHELFRAMHGTPIVAVMHFTQKCYENGYAWLNDGRKYVAQKYGKTLFEDRKQEVDALSPFKTTTFGDRVNSLSLATMESVKEQLLRPVNRYFWLCSIESKYGHPGDVVVMDFQNSYPGAPNMGLCYAQEAAKILRTQGFKQEYDQELEHLVSMPVSTFVARQIATGRDPGFTPDPDDFERDLDGNPILCEE